MLPSFLQARVHLSVPINGLFISIKDVPSSIRRFCTPAFFHHENQPVFDMTWAGSTFLIRYRGRNLAICTRHQLRSAAAQAEQFMLMFVEPDGSRIGLSPNSRALIRMEHSQHLNLEDILLLEYEDQRNGRDLRRLFLDFDLSQTLEAVPVATVQTNFAIGYPTVSGEVSTMDDEYGVPIKLNIDLRRVQLYLEPAEGMLMDTENRIPMVPDAAANQEFIDPDGMSGAPVFYVSIDSERKAILGFAGMITDACPERYMVYDGALIRRVVDDYINKHPR